MERKIKVVVKEVLMAQNISKIWELRRFVTKRLGVKWGSLAGGIFIAPCDDGNRHPLKYRPTDTQVKEYMQEVVSLHKRQGAGIGWPQDGKKNRLCEAGFHRCNISPHGRLNPCVQLRLNKNNSLRRKSFKEIWLRHPDIKKIRNLFIEDRVECQGCEFMDYCMLCPGIALLEEGSMLAKLPDACRAAKMLREAAKQSG